MGHCDWMAASSATVVATGKMLAEMTEELPARTAFVVTASEPMGMEIAEVAASFVVAQAWLIAVDLLQQT